MTNQHGHHLKETTHSNKIVQKGNLVALHYVAKLADGTIFETTEKKPLRFIVGEHTTIPGLEEGVLGMHVGEKRRIIIPPEKAYGKYHKDLVEEVPLSKIPAEVTPAVGVMFRRETQKGSTIFTRITKVNRETVVIDMNHPFAGKTLVFDVVVMDVQ